MKDKVVLIASGTMVVAAVALTIALAPFASTGKPAPAAPVAGNAPAAPAAAPQGGNTVIQAQPGQTVDANGQLSNGQPVAAEEKDDLHPGPVQPDEPLTDKDSSDAVAKANAQDHAPGGGQTPAPTTSEGRVVVNNDN